MITHREILALRDEWQLRADVIEKDWALGWLLAAIAAHSSLGAWVFKGGTCLRKCYYETYRFSEDLDFTVASGGPEEPADLLPFFRDVASWLDDHAGLELLVDERSFVRRKNRRGQPTTMGRIGFRGPSNQPTAAKIKLDLTSDEVLAYPPVLRGVMHPYSDAADPPSLVACYPIVELLAEKLRALTERCRPRDLYDVVHVYRHPDLLGQASSVASALDQKCQHAGVAVPDLAAIHTSPYRAEIEAEWANMLAHQLPSLPPFEQFWNTLDEVFGWLHQQITLPTLPRAEIGTLDPAWIPSRSMTTWHTGAPLELVRFAGANRLKAEIDYRAEQGRRGPRVVEPYSLRRTNDGNIVLFVVNDHGRLRSYRIDRIVSISLTRESFQPRYVVEF